MNKEVLNQITELIELAAEINSKGREKINVDYNGSQNTISLSIVTWSDDNPNVIYLETCYLSWEPDSSYGTDIMFPEFREKLQELITEKAVC